MNAEAIKREWYRREIEQILVNKNNIAAKQTMDSNEMN
jgi:hypothetical protein